ncbi:vinexin-like isoform X2 [Dendronephthya gigantea]|uniref:vinexin-like isoform X2 n=1 Tax=Dendronephthya gigantea TaxID=151771 RepID=UPI00106BE314|nr:vinexin-like isoform X2 [Dendronephthya gigantea]
MASETFEVSLHGGSPWGFRLQGGKEFRAPLLIAKVTAGSKAAKNGIIVGDILIRINNEPCEDMTHSNALNCVKKSGKDLILTLERRPFDANEAYSYKSLPRGTKITNGDVSNNNNVNEYKSVEGYATLPRSKQSKNNPGVEAELKQRNERPDSLDTRSSSGVSSKYTEEDDDLLTRGYGVMSPSNEDWSPDLISDAVRTPQPIRLISMNEPVSMQYSNTETPRVKSPTTIHGFTDKPSPVGRGARRNNDEENADSTDNDLLTSGSTANENIPDDDESGNHNNSANYSPDSHSRPAITHMVKRREGVPMPLPDASADNWHKYHYVDDERKKKAAEQPYRRYSYHGSVLRDDESKLADTTERPRIQAGSGWYKELFKEMHTGAGNSTGLSSLLAGDVSPPPKNDARGLFKSYRERATPAQEAGLRATKVQETQADPTNSGRFSRPEASIETNNSYRHSMSSFPSSTEGVKMREKPTTRNNVPSWYKEFQKGKEVSEKEITDDQKQPRNYQAPGSTRPPGDIGPEYPVVRSYSLGTRPASGPVVHREPPKRMHTHNYQQKANVTNPTNRETMTTRRAGPPVQKEPEKPSASNFYEDHMKKRQFSPHPERRASYEPVDYIKQFEEEEEKIREDERRAKEDLERKLREEEKAKEEAEQRRREAERMKKEEMEAKKNPKHARALYNFSPQSSKEIGFRKGDIVLFYRPIDTNWCEGEAQGQIGLYPISYVEIIEESANQLEGEGKVKYNFKAESPRELNLQKGDIVGIIRQIDNNWFEGVKDEKIGIFPVSYIEVLKEPENSQEGSPKRVQEEVIAKQNGLPEVESAVDGFPEPISLEPDINSLDGEKFTVVFTYAPQNEDELELQEGDIVKVVEKCDDGWFVGISERTGEFGTFPGNYVKLL